MAFAPLILKGNLSVDGSDVDDQVTSFKFMGERDQVTVPATFGARSSSKAGNDTYTVEIAYLQDQDSAALTQVFWDALADGDGTVTIVGSFESGAVSASNPSYTATAVVTEVGMGGAVNEVGQDTVTFPLTDRPTKATS